MKAKRIALFALSTLILASCGKNPSPQTSSEASSFSSESSAVSSESPSSESLSSIEKSISCDISKASGLPGHAYEIGIHNDTGEQLIVSIGDAKYDLVSASVRGIDKIEISLLKEGTGFVEVRTASAASIRIDVECIDLKIVNASDNIPVGASGKVELSHPVKATYEVDTEDVEIDQDGNITPKKETDFTVTVRYGFITVSKTFDSYQKISSLETMNRENPKVRWIGRAYHGPDGVELNNGASGFEVLIHGTSLSGSMSGWFGAWYGKTELNVYVDGAKEPTNVVVLDKATTIDTYTLVQGLEEGAHSIKVTKRTEGLSTSWTLYGLTTDGYFKNPDRSRRLQIEAYGDSITAGYGNLRGDLADTTNSTIQDANQTWATFTASNLDADINVVARTGIGLYTSAGIAEDLQMNDVGGCVNLDGEKLWNHSNYTPDLVLINLGTNDSWDSRFNLATFTTEYVSFVEDLEARYGDETRFVLCSGFMEVAVNSYLQTIASTLKEEFPGRVLTYKFDKCLEGHPKADEHKAGADKLAAYIKENGFDAIREEPSPVDPGDPTGATTDLVLNVELSDIVPEYATLHATAQGETWNGEADLEKVDAFHYTATIPAVSSDATLSIGLGNGTEADLLGVQTRSIAVREGNPVHVKLDSFNALPEDPTPDPLNGWRISTAIYDVELTSPEANAVDYKNASNWLAGFGYHKAEQSKNVELSAHIALDEAVTGETYIGLCPYYVDDLNYIVVYLQWRAGGTFGGVGCTGLINGSNIGWNDYASLSSISVDMTEGVDMKIDRNSTEIAVTINGVTQAQTFYGIAEESPYYGIYAECPQTVHYTNVSEAASSRPAPAKWTVSPCLFDEKLEVLSDNKIKLTNYNNWLAGLALAKSEATDNYTVSASITSAKDAYTASDDVQIALVPYYRDANNFTLLYLQWNDSGAIKSIGCTGYRDGTWTGWDDLWDFAGLGSHLLTGDTFKVTRKANVLTVSYGGITVNKTIAQGMSDNYAYGFWCHNCAATFSNITFTAL